MSSVTRGQRTPRNRLSHFPRACGEFRDSPAWCRAAGSAAQGRRDLAPHLAQPVVSSPTISAARRPDATSCAQLGAQPARKSLIAASASRRAIRVLDPRVVAPLRAARSARSVRPVVARLAAGITGRGGQVGPQGLHRVVDRWRAPRRRGAAPSRVSSSSMPSSSRPRVGELGAPGVGDRVDGLAAVGFLGDEALLLELREARVDRAGARDVGAAEALAERLDELVAVHRPLVEQAQQVEPQVAVGEDRGSGGSLPATAGVQHADVAADRVARARRASGRRASPYLPV